MRDVEGQADHGYVVVEESVLQFGPEVLRARVNERHGVTTIALGVSVKEAARTPWAAYPTQKRCQLSKSANFPQYRIGVVQAVRDDFWFVDGVLAVKRRFTNEQTIGMSREREAQHHAG